MLSIEKSSALSNDRRGFIFSLDAALAIVIVMVALAGVARVGSLGFYESYGYLRLERYANDAMEALYSVGTLDENGVLTNAYDNIRTLLKRRDSRAENVAENWLARIFAADLCFRLIVYKENLLLLDNVFPEPGNHAAWRAAFENAREFGVAHRLWLVGENFVTATLYVWRWPRP